MKITHFGPGGLPIAMAGWSTGIVSLNSNVEIIGGGPAAINFVQRITSNTSNTLLNPIVNFASGSNIAFAVQSNTLTIIGQSGSGGVDALRRYIGVRLELASLSVNADTETAVSFPTEVFDEGGLHNTSSNTDRITIVEAGKYHIGGDAVFGTRSDTQLAGIDLNVNGVRVAVSEVDPDYHADHPAVGLAVATHLELGVGDYIQLKVFHDNTAAVSATASDIALWAYMVGSVGASSLTINDEGTPLATSATSLDFVGAGVVASGAGASKTITISGGGSVSAGSNSTRVREISTAGASTTLWSPFDHAHDGIGTITASSSNTMQRGTWNLRPGVGIALSLADTDGDGEFDTTTVSSTVVGGSGGVGNSDDSENQIVAMEVYS